MELFFLKIFLGFVVVMGIISIFGTEDQIALPDLLNILVIVDKLGFGVYKKGVYLKMIKKALILLLLTVLIIVGYNYEQLSNFLTKKIFAKETNQLQQKFKNKTSQKRHLQHIVIDNFKLTLSGCHLQYEGLGKKELLKFPFPKPCYFSLDPTKKIRVVNTGKSKTVLIHAAKEINLSDNSTSKKFFMYLRGIIIFKNKIELSKEIKTGILESFNPFSIQYDKKLYHILAAKTVPITELKISKKPRRTFADEFKN